MQRETVHTFTGLVAEVFFIECRRKLRGTGGSQALKIVSVDEMRLEHEESDGWSVTLDTADFQNLDILDDGGFTEALIFGQIYGPGSVVVDEHDGPPNAPIAISGDNILKSVAHSFRLTNDAVLVSVRFHGGSNTGVLTGNVYAKLYATSGTHGTDAVPSGAALATSDPVAASSIEQWGVAGGEYVEFTFPSAYTLEAGVTYAIAVEYTVTGLGGNSLLVNADPDELGHAGNRAQFDGSTWTPVTTSDLVFTVYGRRVPAPGDDYMLVAECTVQYLPAHGSGQTEMEFRRPARVVASALNPVS